MKYVKWLLMSGVFIHLNCARSPIKEMSQSLRPVQNSVEFKDEYDKESLVRVLNQHKNYFEKKEAQHILYFGPKKISAVQYLLELEKLIRSLESPDLNQFQKVLNENFDVYEVYGQKKYSDVFITSYFNPIVKASLKKTETLSQALYETPKDLVNIYWSDFLKELPQLKNYDTLPEAKSLKKIIRARIVSEEGRPPKIIPYYSREQIDGEQKISAQVIAWVDPLDAFFLQIQGSALLEYSDGKRSYVGYSSQNGHPYVAIGRFLVDKIPLKEMSLQKIEDHLRTLSKEDQNKILFQNPSYVFFQKINSKPLTTVGTEVVPGRTIATDGSYFPKGVLAFLKFEKPQWEKNELKWQKTSRFVMDQDTGGAIKGPGRVDLYWGEGEEAKKNAGVMKGRGELYYFVPKSAEDIIKTE